MQLQTTSVCRGADQGHTPDDRKDDVSTGSHDSESDSDEEPPLLPFPEVEAAIVDAVARFGSVFPRLNWTAPAVRSQ